MVSQLYESGKDHAQYDDEDHEVLDLIMVSGHYEALEVQVSMVFFNGFNFGN